MQKLIYELFKEKKLDRSNIFIKYAIILYKVFKVWNYIKKTSFKYSIIFLPYIIYSKKKFEEDIFSEKFNKKKKYYINKYKFSYHDTFSNNIPHWEKILQSKKKFSYLEIGCFEGRSTVFIGEKKGVKEIAVVDMFGGDYGITKKVNFKIVYKNFIKNKKILNKKIKLYKVKSSEFFKKNKKKFDIIYIDGSHHYKDVKNDFINSLKILLPDGILICDDFLWKNFKDNKLNPINAIIECYTKFKNNLEILYINEQIIFKKKKN